MGIQQLKMWIPEDEFNILVHKYMRALSTMKLDDFQMKMSKLLNSIEKKDKYEYNGWSRSNTSYFGSKYDSPYGFMYNIAGTPLEPYAIASTPSK